MSVQQHFEIGSVHCCVIQYTIVTPSKPLISSLHAKLHLDLVLKLTIGLDVFVQLTEENVDQVGVLNIQIMSMFIFL